MNTMNTLALAADKRPASLHATKRRPWAAMVLLAASAAACGEARAQTGAEVGTIIEAEDSCSAEGGSWECDEKRDPCVDASGSWVCEEESGPGPPDQDAEIRAFSGRQQFLAALTAEVARLQLKDVQVHRGTSDEVLGVTFEKQSDLENVLRGLGGEAEQPLETTTHLLSAEDNRATWPHSLVPPEVATLLKIGSTIIGAYGNVMSAWEGLNKTVNFLAGIDAPSQLDLQFAELHRHMDQLGFETMELVANHAQALRNTWAKVASGQAKQALVEQPGFWREELLAHADNNSRLAVTYALEEAAFQRKIKGKEGLSYDWRVGVPHLIWAVGVRLHVLKVMDELNPLVVDGARVSFPRRFRGELLDLRDGLYAHYTRVSDGVEYWEETSKWHKHFIVRDKNTNIETINFSGHRPEKNEIVIDQMFTILPVFELQAALDALEATLMSGDIPGFVDFGLYGRLVVDAAPDLCLQSNHYISYWNTATIERCEYDIINGSHLSRQLFTYDRATGQIKEYFGNCLAVENHYLWGHGLVTSVPCGTKNYYDKWSWDPWNHVFRNKMGRSRVLDIRWGVLAPGSSVWTWPVHFGDAQRFSYGTTSR